MPAAKKQRTVYSISSRQHNKAGHSKSSSSGRAATSKATTTEEDESKWTKARLWEEVNRLREVNASLGEQLRQQMQESTSSRKPKTKTSTLLGKRVRFANIWSLENEGGDGGDDEEEGENTKRINRLRKFMRKYHRRRRDDEEEEEGDKDDSMKGAAKLSEERKQELAAGLEAARRCHALLASPLPRLSVRGGGKGGPAGTATATGGARNSRSNSSGSPEATNSTADTSRTESTCPVAAGGTAAAGGGAGGSCSKNIFTLPLVDLLTSEQWGLLADEMISNLGVKELRRIGLCSHTFHRAQLLNNLSACAVDFSSTTEADMPNLLGFLNNLQNNATSNPPQVNGAGGAAAGAEQWNGLSSLRLRRPNSSEEGYLRSLFRVVQGTLQSVTIDQFSMAFRNEVNEVLRGITSLPTLRVLRLHDIAEPSEILPRVHQHLQSISFTGYYILEQLAPTFHGASFPALRHLDLPGLDTILETSTERSNFAHNLIQATPLLETLHIRNAMEPVFFELYEVLTARKREGRTGWNHMRVIQSQDRIRECEGLLNSDDILVRLTAIAAGALPSLENLYLRCTEDTPVLTQLTDAWKAGHFSKVQRLHLSVRMKVGEFKKLVDTWLDTDKARSVVTLTLGDTSMNEEDFEHLFKSILIHRMLPAIRRLDLGIFSGLAFAVPSLLQALDSGWAANLTHFGLNRFRLFGIAGQKFHKCILETLQDGKMPMLNSLDLSFTATSHPQLVPVLTCPSLSCLYTLSLNQMDLGEKFLVHLAEALIGRRSSDITDDGDGTGKEEEDEENGGGKKGNRIGGRGKKKSIKKVLKGKSKKAKVAAAAGEGGGGAAAADGEGGGTAAGSDASDGKEKEEKKEEEITMVLVEGLATSAAAAPPVVPHVATIAPLQRLARLDMEGSRLTGPGITAFANILAEGVQQEGVVALPSLHCMSLRFNNLGDAPILALLTSVILEGSLPKLSNLKVDRIRRIEDFDGLKEVGKRDRPELWRKCFQTW